MQDQKVFMITKDDKVVQFDLKEQADDKKRLEVSDFHAFDKLNVSYMPYSLVSWHPN